MQIILSLLLGSSISPYLQPVLALHGLPGGQRLGKLDERLVREPGLVVQHVEHGLRKGKGGVSIRQNEAFFCDCVRVSQKMVKAILY